jgi:hypothetical protein
MLDQAIDGRQPIGVDGRPDGSQTRHRFAAQRDHHFLARHHSLQKLREALVGLARQISMHRILMGCISICSAYLTRISHSETSEEPIR